MRRKICMFWIVFSCLALCFVSLIGVFSQIQQSEPTLASYSATPIVIIDAGHGGMDGGAMGVDGQIEKEINLSIALKLDTMLRAYGFETILTRNSDVSIHSADAKTVRQQKSSDLKNRLKLLEDTSSGILISIHQNKYSQSSACGTQVFYGRNCPESKELAEMLQKYYQGSNFISVVNGDGQGKIYANELANTNQLKLIVEGNDERISLTALFDNLGKGASGAAVQNMNIALGLDETCGLV